MLGLFEAHFEEHALGVDADIGDAHAEAAAHEGAGQEEFVPGCAGSRDAQKQGDGENDGQGAASEAAYESGAHEQGRERRQAEIEDKHPDFRFVEACLLPDGGQAGCEKRVRESRSEEKAGAGETCPGKAGRKHIVTSENKRSRCVMQRLAMTGRADSLFRQIAAVCT